jgi:glycosyltransferase involved in cell wall biosynthesis
MSNEIKPVCILQGPIASRAGYGEHCRGVAAALINHYNKFELKIAPTRWGGCPNTELDDESRPMVKEFKSRLLNAPLQAQPELYIQVAIPNEFQTPGKFNVGITAGIESTVPKAEWIEGLNRMQLNIVPSKFSKEVFEKAVYTKTHPDGKQEVIKMTKPMEIVFEGVDTNIFKKTSEKSGDIDLALDPIPEPFCFLFVGHWLQGDLGADRKDVGMLVKVFSEVFKNRKNAPALILKTSGAGFSQVDKHDILKKIHNVRKHLTGSLPNIYPTEMNRLYNHPKVKAHVTFSHGEGFCIPLLEASLSGKPIIATDWSGHLDFLPKELAVLLPGSIVPVPSSAVNEWIIRESAWCAVNYSVAAQKLEEMFDKYLKFIPNAELLRIQNAEKFNLEASNKALVAVLEKHLPVFEKKIQIVLPRFKKIVPAALPSASPAPTASQV